MTAITYGFGNIGRTKHGSSAGVDKSALTSLKNALPDKRAAVFLCEINEGDDNNELALVRQVFKGWTVYAGNKNNKVREPILLSPDFRPAKWRVQWVKDSGVKKWSPRRSLLVVNLSEESTTFLAMHYPAGAHGQGDRPDWAKPLLDKAWDNCLKVHRSNQRRLVEGGRCVVWCMDTNDYTMPKIMGSERTVVHDATDWLRVTGTRGLNANFKKLAKVDFKIDSHDGQRMRGQFNT